MTELYITAKELLEKSIREPDWQVDKIISEGGITMIAGTKKSNKSFLALYIAVCVATGKPVLEKYEVKKGRVLYIDEENGEVETKNRLKRVMAGLGVEECDMDFLIYKDLKLEHRKNTALRKKHQDFIKDYIEKRKPVLIICDSMVRFMLGEENSSSDVREVFDFIKPFKEKTSWLLLHHTTKGKADARGSGDFFAMVDDALTLQRIGKGIDKHTFNLRTNSSRRSNYIVGDKYKVIGEEGEPLIFEYKGEDELQPRRKVFEVLADKIMEWVKGEELTTFKRKQINAQFKNHPVSRITDALNYLLEERVLKQEVKGTYNVNEREDY